MLLDIREERGRAMVEKSQKNQIRHTDLGAPLEVVYKRQTHLVTRSNRTKMSRLIIVVLAVVVLLQVVCAIDLSTTKNVEISFADEDVVPKTALKSLPPDLYAAQFIGNLEIGRHYPDETVFRRVIEFNNPTNSVQSSTLTLTVTNGIIHYVNVVNDRGSYAVVCDELNTLGSSRGNINIRAAAKTKSYLTIVTAVH